jgi:hypothetical protein
LILNAGPHQPIARENADHDSGWGKGILVGLLISGALTYWYSTRPEKVCVVTEQALVPIYAPGPKHHINGRVTGYINDHVCVKWDVKPTDRKKPFTWPDPVY